MKRLVLAVVLVCSVAWQGMAQLATVEVNSAAQLLWNIQQFYQMYDEYMAALQRIQQNYEMFQHSIEQARSWSWDDISWDGDFDFRNEIQQAGRQVNSLLTDIRKARDALTRENITVNGHNYSFADLADIHGDKNITVFASDVVTKTTDTFRSMAETWEKGLTNQEQAYIYAKFGISPANYYMVKEGAQWVDDKFTDALAAVEGTAANIEKKSKVREQLAGMYKLIWEHDNGEEMTEKMYTQVLSNLSLMNVQELMNMREAAEKYVSYNLWHQKHKEDEARRKEEGESLKMEMMASGREEDPNF